VAWPTDSFWFSMDAPPPLPPDVLSALPAAVIALIQWQAAQIERLTARVAELEAKLGKDSTNSSKPPSTEHPHAKPTRSKPKSKRSHGGQPGHAKHERTLVPVEDCTAVIPCLPDTCRNCGAALTGADPDPIRHPVWELPEIKPLITEYRRHRLVCRCGCSTCGVLPQGVPTGQAGPRLIAFGGLLMAGFRQSKRRAALFLGTILDQPACPAWMVSLQGRASEAVGPAYEELSAALPNAKALYLDESPSKEGRNKSWVWTFVASTFTVFACRRSRAADVPRQLLGAFAGVIHCDRARMYWAFDRLQYCWAHLRRDFQGLIDSPCGVRRRLGHDLMRPTKEMFALWEKVRDGTLSRSEFRDRMVGIRRRVEGVLLRGYYDGRVRGFCADLWEHRARLWVFVDVDGVEPTNNAAERSLRHAVIWRKLSFGTQSAGGSRFVERMLSVIETCRQQKRDVFAWMVNAVQAHLAHRPAPSLLPGA
jgi:transposase